MIVTRDQARWIAQGKKNQHRLPATSVDCRFIEGRDYAITIMAERDENELYGYSSTIVVRPGEGNRSTGTRPVRRRRRRIAQTVARVAVTSIRRQRLGDMTVLDARAEGHRTTGEYLAAWAERHGHADPDLEVWVLEFHLLRQNHDRVRLLHAHSEHGYTADERTALPEEPEAVDEVTAARFAKEASDRDDVMRRQRAAWIAGLPPAERMHVLGEEARARRVDISHHERVIEDRLERIQRQLNGDGRAA